jgi:hypothetical protein
VPLAEPPVEPLVDPGIEPLVPVPPKLFADVLPEVPVPVVPELDMLGLSDEVVPVDEGVEPPMAPEELSELVEPRVPAALAGVPPPTTSGAMPLRAKTWHCAVVFHVPVAWS